MKTVNVLLGLSAITSASARSFSSLFSRQDVTCYEGALIIVARGSGEPAGTGVTGEVADKIAAQIPNSHVQALDYPASFDDYFTSEPEGVKSMTEAIEQYVDACPDGNLILIGYSQGAAVVGDTICGTNDTLMALDPTQPLPTKYGDHIHAVLSFGDPSFVPGLPIDAGSAQKEGIFPRGNSSACDPYYPIWKSYCDTNDFYCASGTTPDAHEVHGSYVERRGAQAEQQIVSIYDDSTGTQATGSPSASPTSSSGMAQQTGAASGNALGAPAVAVVGVSCLYAMFM